MITKTGSLLKEALANVALAGGLGAYRADKLTPEQRQSLIAKHNLDENSNLVLRNAGRSAGGYLLGSLPGGIMAGIGKTMMDSAVKPTARRSLKDYVTGRRPQPNFKRMGRGAGLGVLGMLGSIAGGVYGANRASKKYSPSELE